MLPLTLLDYLAFFLAVPVNSKDYSSVRSFALLMSLPEKFFPQFLAWLALPHSDRYSNVTSSEAFPI